MTVVRLVLNRADMLQRAATPARWLFITHKDAKKLDAHPFQPSEKLCREPS